MGTTATPNYGWLYPNDGEELDTWGPILNQLFEDVDSVVDGIDSRVTSLEAGGSSAVSVITGNGNLDLTAGRVFIVNVSGPTTATITNHPSGDGDAIAFDVIFRQSGGGYNVAALAASTGALLYAGAADMASAPDLSGDGEHHFRVVTWKSGGTVRTVAAYLGRRTEHGYSELTGAGTIRPSKSLEWRVNLTSSGAHTINIADIVNVPTETFAELNILVQIPASGRSCTIQRSFGSIQWDSKTWPSEATAGNFVYNAGKSYWVKILITRIGGTTFMWGTRAVSP